MVTACNSLGSYNADTTVAVCQESEVGSDGIRLVYTPTQGVTITLKVPAGAVTDQVTLLYLPLAGVTSPPAGFSFADYAFELDAYKDGVLQPSFGFAARLTITLHYNDEDVAGLDEETLRLVSWAGTQWVDATYGAYERHPNQNWLSAPICHLSGFGLFGQEEASGEKWLYLPIILRDS